MLDKTESKGYSGDAGYIGDYRGYQIYGHISGIGCSPTGDITESYTPPLVSNGKDTFDSSGMSDNQIIQEIDKRLE
ncbi:hypothetical protein OAF54_02820 [bacterium]|nr:hypothetical protein [bacterium]